MTLEEAKVFINSLIQIEEGEVKVGDKLYYKSPGFTSVRRVVVARMTKRFIFANIVGETNAEPVKFRQDGTLVSDEHCRVCLYKRP